MTNAYKLELNGCGHRPIKMIRLELSAEDAQRLANWNLNDLDCCGGPILTVTPIKDQATYGTGILREDNDG